MAIFNIRKITTYVNLYKIEAEDAEMAILEAQRGEIKPAGSGSNIQFAIMEDAPSAPKIEQTKDGVRVPVSMLSRNRSSSPAAGPIALAPEPSRIGG